MCIPGVVNLARGQRNDKLRLRSEWCAESDRDTVTGAFSDSNVPNAYFNPDNRQLNFDRDNPDANGNNGFRPAARRNYFVRTEDSQPAAMRPSSSTRSLQRKNCGSEMSFSS